MRLQMLDRIGNDGGEWGAVGVEIIFTATEGKPQRSEGAVVR